MPPVLDFRIECGVTITYDNCSGIKKINLVPAFGRKRQMDQARGRSKSIPSNARPWPVRIGRGPYEWSSRNATHFTFPISISEAFAFAFPMDRWHYDGQ